MTLAISCVVGGSICFDFIKFEAVMPYEISMFCLVIVLFGVLIHQLQEKKQVASIPPKLRKEPSLQIVSLLEFIPNAMLVVDEKGQIISQNKKALSIFAYTTAEELQASNTIQDLLQNCQEKSILTQVRNCIKQNVIFEDVNVIAVREDYSSCVVSIEMKPLKVGEQKYAAITLQDFNLQKVETEHLSLQYFSVERATDSLFWLDKNAQIIYSNETATRFLGYSTLEMSLLSISQIVPEIEGNRWNEVWNLVKDCGSIVTETSFQGKDGRIFPVEVVLNYIALNDNEYVCAYVRDIAYRKDKEEQLTAYAQELKEKNKALEQFMYIASHNLQEPLRNISSFAQLLSKRYEGKLDGQADEFIGYVVGGVKQMQNLLHDLSSYAHISSKSKSFAIHPMNLVVKDSLQQLNHQIEENKAVITYDELPEVRGDYQELVKVFENLVCNAIKYKSKRKPKIHIGVEKRHCFWVFSIRDNGMGIDEEYKEKIFRIFTRLHNNKKYKGTGIGLAICQKIIEKHGGQIWVDTTTKKGTTFYFSLPIPVQIYKQTA